MQKPKNGQNVTYCVFTCGVDHANALYINKKGHINRGGER